MTEVSEEIAKIEAPVEPPKVSEVPVVEPPVITEAPVTEAPTEAPEPPKPAEVPKEESAQEAPPTAKRTRGRPKGSSDTIKRTRKSKQLPPPPLAPAPVTPSTPSLLYGQPAPPLQFPPITRAEKRKQLYDSWFN